jgi:hypothetical protein
MWRSSFWTMTHYRDEDAKKECLTFVTTARYSIDEPSVFLPWHRHSLFEAKRQKTKSLSQVLSWKYLLAREIVWMRGKEREGDKKCGWSTAQLLDQFVLSWYRSAAAGCKVDHKEWGYLFRKVTLTLTKQGRFERLMKLNHVRRMTR